MYGQLIQHIDREIVCKLFNALLAALEQLQMYVCAIV
jgi:hypothetical protein